MIGWMIFIVVLMYAILGITIIFLFLKKLGINLFEEDISIDLDLFEKLHPLTLKCLYRKDLSEINEEESN